MSGKIINVFGLLIAAGVIAVLANNPQLVNSFFIGSRGLLRTALSGGSR